MRRGSPGTAGGGESAGGERLEAARRAAHAQAEALRLAAVYVLICVAFAFVGNVVLPGPRQVWLWPAGILGVVLVYKLIAAFVLDSPVLRDRWVRREMKRMDGDRDRNRDRNRD